MWKNDEILAPELGENMWLRKDEDNDLLHLTVVTFFFEISY